MFDGCMKNVSPVGGARLLTLSFTSHVALLSPPLQYPERGENITGHTKQRGSELGEDRQRGTDVAAKQDGTEVDQPGGLGVYISSQASVYPCVCV